AGLNAEYPQSSMQLSVTMHEIGHVLGLDHSMKRSSIMFPVDQGRTSFSKEDLATLRKIYQ
ncbi:matrixin family metalloprotease, partial [Lentilactobacillus hilgardii]